MKLSQPIIVVGAGRSGSSLLNRVLNAHPEIVMCGEMNETASLLWRKFLNLEPIVDQRNLRTAAEVGFGTRARLSEKDSATSHRTEAEERARIGSIIQTAITDLLQVNAGAEKFWGFQEIWVSSAEKVRWEALDAVFPLAQYLHILRHPLDFSRSFSDWHRRALDGPELRENLLKWVDYRAANLSREQTGRYTRIKYEDLIRNPAKTLQPFMSKIGLNWNFECQAILEVRTKEAGLRSSLPEGAEEIMSDVPGLFAALDHDGYERMRLDLLGNFETKPAATSISAEEWLLEPPFLHDGGHARISKVYSVPGLLDHVGPPDNDADVSSSRLTLLEDGKALGPAHSLHATIRTVGRGAYSYWGDEPTLHFSASDNTDPNTNGRSYSVIVR